MNKKLNINAEFEALIPPLTNEEYNQLKQNLQQQGCLDSIKVWEGTIVDGHNRYGICTDYEIDFQIENLYFEDENAAKLWIITNQFGRRNLTAFSRAELALKMEEVLAAKARQRQITHTKEGYQNSGEAERTDHKLADIAQTSHDTIYRVATILAKADEDTKNQLRKGDVSINKVYSAIKREMKLEELKAPSFPSSKYRVVYADPPWKYGNSGLDNYGHAERHYPCMSIEELCVLPVRELADDNAVLFLWVTSPFLEDVFKIIKAWGFEYKSSFVWDKVKHNFGYYNSVRHEFLLICTRGSCLPDVKELRDSVISIERSSEHSEKPEDFRQMIDFLYPHGKRIELFSRKEIKGWDRYGNELLQK